MDDDEYEDGGYFDSLSGERGGTPLRGIRTPPSSDSQSLRAFFGRTGHVGDVENENLRNSNTRVPHPATAMTLLGRSNDGSTGRPGVFHSPRQEHTAAYWDHNAAYTGEYWHDDIPRDDAIAQGDPAYSGHTDPSFASYSDNPLTAATTPPNFRTRLSGTRRNNHPANSSTHRATYWAQGRPVLKEEKWNNITAMLPTLPPRTEKRKSSMFA